MPAPSLVAVQVAGVVEQCADGVGGVGVHGGQDVRVGVHGHRDGGVFDMQVIIA